MRFLYVLVLVLFLASCAKSIQIKQSSQESIIKGPYISTTEGVIEKEEQDINASPKIQIISPKDNEVILGQSIDVVLNVSNFRLVGQDSYPNIGQGFVHVFVDDMEASGQKNKFSFNNLAGGDHVIAALLELTNNTIVAKSEPVKVTVPSKTKSNVVKNETESLSEFKVEADDKGFYPSMLRAKIGDKVKLDFRFRDDSIYYAGLDVKGPFEDIKYKLNGEQPITREFIVNQQVKIDSYWPSTGVHKATLIVEVT